MKVKTADLVDAPLDWAVAKCKGFKKIRAMPEWSNKHGAHGGPQVMVSNEEDSSFDYRPSTNWSQGGPLIAQHIFLLEDLGDYEWEATATNGCKYRGDTVLQAVCRAHVASQLGDEVDIPEELLK